MGEGFQVMLDGLTERLEEQSLDIQTRMRIDAETRHAEHEQWRSDVFTLLQRLVPNTATAPTVPVATPTSGLPVAPVPATPVTAPVTQPWAGRPRRRRPPLEPTLYPLLPPALSHPPLMPTRLPSLPLVPFHPLRHLLLFHSPDVVIHLSMCELAFWLEREPLSEEQKILISVNKCSKGAAAAWHSSSIQAIASGAWVNKTWSEYKESFNATFGNPFLEAEGNREMASAVQRDGETTSAFLMRFETYRAKAGMTDPTFDTFVIRMLRDKLPPKIKDKANANVTSYEEFKAIVIRQDNKLREADRAKVHFEKLQALDAAATAASNGYTNRRSYPQRSTSAPVPGTGNPSTVATSTPNPVVPVAVKKSNAESAASNPVATVAASTPTANSTQPFRGFCFNCGQRDHKKADCPQPAKNAGSRIAMILQQATEALVHAGNEECASDLTSPLPPDDSIHTPLPLHTSSVNNICIDEAPIATVSDPPSDSIVISPLGRVDRSHLHGLHGVRLVLERIRVEPLTIGLGILTSWTHSGRSDEVNELLISFLYDADDASALQVLRQLKEAPMRISSLGAKSFLVPLSLKDASDDHEIDQDALLDSGAENCYAHSQFIADKGLLPSVLPHPIGVYNVDGSLNTDGCITHFIDLTVSVKNHDHVERLRFYITNLGSVDLILGLSWLKLHNPLVDGARNASPSFDARPQCTKSSEHVADRWLRQYRQIRPMP
ncbi:hypothetical protein NMY22_g10062 [Coprinellus aureogranulatus]|nr:hypothetical protein NMY22_g10062 [Coprinellus aureogranulatus]